jgi:hypothetical protein
MSEHSSATGAEGVADSEIAPLTKWDDLRDSWKRLSERKMAATGRGS